MTGIVDYGVGNLYSLRCSLSALQIEHRLVTKKEDLMDLDHIILPGVGAFEDAANRLRNTEMWDPLTERAHMGVPLLGICLGMQLLFEDSCEYGLHRGLHLINGHVRPLKDRISSDLKVPHMGWNRLDILRPDPIFRYFPVGGYVYYVHSYYAADCGPSTLAASEYSIPVTGVVRNENVYGMQFHPEKSGRDGLALLKAFSEMEV